MTTYDVQQTGELIGAMRETRLFVPTLLAVLLGMRRGEIAALRWRSINLEAGQIAVVESAEQMNGAVRMKPPKSGRARTVALAQMIVEELRAHRIAQAQELLKLGVRLSDDHFVCTHADGRMMQPTWITPEWVRRIRGTALPAYRFMTFATPTQRTCWPPEPILRWSPQNGWDIARSGSHSTSTAM